MTYDPFDPFNEVPMYTDYFLKFNDEAEANAALFTEQTNVDGDIVETVLVPKYAAVDVVGTIYKPTGKVLPAEDESGEAAPLGSLGAFTCGTAGFLVFLGRIRVLGSC